MNPRRFDSLTRSLATPKTRRGLLGSLAAVAAGLLGARATDAQVTQAQCGNVVCAQQPGQVATPGASAASTPTATPAAGRPRTAPPRAPSRRRPRPRRRRPRPRPRPPRRPPRRRPTTTTVAPTTTTVAPTTTTVAPTTTTVAPPRRRRRPTTTTAAPTTTTTTTPAPPTTTAAPTTTTTTTAAPTTTTTTSTSRRRSRRRPRPPVVVTGSLDASDPTFTGCFPGDRYDAYTFQHAGEPAVAGGAGRLQRRRDASPIRSSSSSPASSCRPTGAEPLPTTRRRVRVRRLPGDHLEAGTYTAAVYEFENTSRHLHLRAEHLHRRRLLPADHHDHDPGADHLDHDDHRCADMPHVRPVPGRLPGQWQLRPDLLP